MTRKPAPASPVSDFARMDAETGARFLRQLLNDGMGDHAIASVLGLGVTDVRRAVAKSMQSGE